MTGLEWGNGAWGVEECAVCGASLNDHPVYFYRFPYPLCTRFKSQGSAVEGSRRPDFRARAPMRRNEIDEENGLSRPPDAIPIKKFIGFLRLVGRYKAGDFGLSLCRLENRVKPLYCSTVTRPFPSHRNKWKSLTPVLYPRRTCS